MLLGKLLFPWRTYWRVGFDQGATMVDPLTIACFVPVLQFNALIDGHAEPAGTFVWMLQYTDGDTGKHVFQKGTTILIR